MFALDSLAAAISRAALAFSEQRARMGGARKPKAKKKPGKVGRVNKFKNAAGAGCGTGAGGFKAGNNCQKEDGIPNKTQSPYSALKQPNAKAAKQKAAAMKQKAAIKQAKKLAKDKQTSIQAKRKKAAIRKKEKDAKAAESAKQRADALAKKKAEMLKVIRKKRANEKLNILGDKTVDVQQISKNKAQKASQFLKVVDGRPDADVYGSAAKEMVDSVRRAKKSPQCQGNSVGLCSYISEDVANRLSERFKNRKHIEVLQHMPPGKDHASVVIVNHKEKTATEVDIDEKKYQRRTKGGKFIKIKDPNITDKDVEFKDLDYKQFDYNRASPFAKELAESKAAAIAKTAATGKPAPYRKPTSPEAPDPPSPTPNPKDLTIVKPLGGSTGAKLAKDAVGNQYVIKGGNSAEHIRSESAADELYRAAGVNVPKQQVHDTPDGPQKVAEFIKGKTLQELKETNPKQYEAAVKRLRKDFVVDVLLGNRDVVGMNLDNIVVGKGGKVFRVDNGGSLTFRAQGKQKDFGPDADEINTLRDPTVNPSAASVFGRLTDKEVSAQINALMKKKQAVLAAAPNQQIREALEKRFDSLAKWQADFKKATKASNKPKPSSTDASDELTANVPAGVPKQTGKGWSWKARQQLASKIEPSLAAEEKGAILAWGGSSSSFKAQDRQHGADAASKGSQYYKNFVSAVSKLPQFLGGTAYRGMVSVPKTQVERWLKEGMFRHSYEDAWDNTTHASMSTSKRKSISSFTGDHHSQGRVLIKVSKTKRAKDSSGLIKNHPTEEEVVALPGAKYKIRGTHFIIGKKGGALGFKYGKKVSESEWAAAVASTGVSYSGGYDPHKDGRVIRVIEVEEIW